MQVYQFKMWGKKFAVDIESGSFFEIDEVASDAIVLLHHYSEEETARRLNKKYRNEPVTKAIGNLSKLKRKGLLFSTNKIENVNLKRRISDLTLNIVNSCNLRCRYCWNQAGTYGTFPGVKKKMDSRIGIKAVDLLLKESKGAKDLVIDFYGGEPLLNFNLIKEVIGYCRGIQNTNKTRFRFLLATNGTLLNKERGEFLIKNGVDVAVSLDGPRKIQDIQRPFPGGRGSFDMIMNNINALSEDYRKRIVGRATFTPYSTKVVRTFKFLRSLGFERIEICESEKAGYGLESNNQFFFSRNGGLRNLKSIYYNLAIFYAQEMIAENLTYGNTYFNRFFKQLSRLYNLASVVGTCSAGFSLMTVDMDGNIYPCTAFVGILQFRIGTIKSGIDEKKLKVFLDTKISSNVSCQECWAKKICRGCGSCYNLNYFANKNTGQPDSYHCELFRYKTKLMIAIIAKVAEKKPQLLDKILIPEYYATRGRRS